MEWQLAGQDRLCNTGVLAAEEHESSHGAVEVRERWTALRGTHHGPVEVFAGGALMVAGSATLDGPLWVHDGGTTTINGQHDGPLLLDPGSSMILHGRAARRPSLASHTG